MQEKSKIAGIKADGIGRHKLPTVFNFAPAQFTCGTAGDPPVPAPAGPRVIDGKTKIIVNVDRS